ncbi:MAG: hypothetical protein EB023_05285 [Flavobacteriia bacterium]|nr:hypothetical protein [Flavobacteriia bacterium]
MKFTAVLFSFFSLVTPFAQKKHKPFSGELLFSAVRVIPQDSTRESTLIYAKDSLTKIITFASNIGKQELIKHLGVQRSYLLLETNKGKFAVKSDFNKFNDSSFQYKYKKVPGSKKILGKKAKKLIVTFQDIDKEFTFYYFKKIPACYGSAFTSFPGLVVDYFLPTDQGVYHYTLTELKKTDPPLTLFMVPDGYTRLTLDAFMEIMTAP